MSTACILGGAGFIGHNLARVLKNVGYDHVRVADLHYPENSDLIKGVEYVIADLRNPLQTVKAVVDKYQEPYYKSKCFDEYYQLAADMGGAGYVFSGENDAAIMRNSSLININVLEALISFEFKGKIFYSSSACMYPQELQQTNGETWIRWNENDEKKISYEVRGLKESDAYPANPDSEYGWEKLFSERLYQAYHRNHGLDIRIARFHNIYGPEGTYKGGKEKAPAAMCRKVVELLHAVTDERNEVEIWGTGKQTRSFLYIDDCIDAVRLLMQSEFREPINIGSEEMVTIDDLAQMAIDISGKKIDIKHIDGPTGVMGRNSDNTLIRQVLGWEPRYSLRQGMEKTFHWIKSQYE